MTDEKTYLSRWQAFQLTHDLVVTYEAEPFFNKGTEGVFKDTMRRALVGEDTGMQWSHLTPWQEGLYEAIECQYTAKDPCKMGTLPAEPSPGVNSVEAEYDRYLMEFRNTAEYCRGDIIRILSDEIDRLNSRLARLNIAFVCEGDLWREYVSRRDEVVAVLRAYRASFKAVDAYYEGRREESATLKECDKAQKAKATAEEDQS